MNFIFMIPDELRAESLGCYGHSLVQPPNLDAFAAQSTRFEQCHVLPQLLAWLVQTSDVVPHEIDPRGSPVI